MSSVAVGLAVSSGVTATAVSWLVLRPPRYLARRVRPYTQASRSRLARGTDPASIDPGASATALIRAVLSPLVGTVLAIGSGKPADGNGGLAVRLRRSGLYPAMDSDARVAGYRRRRLATATLTGAVLGAAGWQSGGPVGLLTFAAGGFALGAMVAKGRVDRAIRQRCRRVRAELYTINQILAMRARAGGGVTDALRHVAQRSHGVVAEELADILGLVRSGIPLPAALRRTAEVTAEPETARLYRSLAVAHERGVDLADTLLALAKDLRVARRDDATTHAAKARVTAVVPIVVVLGPIAIALMAAPLPTLIFGNGAP